MHYLYLAISIFAEVAATSLLKQSEGFTKPWITFTVLVGYTSSFYFLSLTLRVMPVGIVYAVWSGIGIIVISLGSYLLYGEKLDAAALVGIGLILAGVLTINLFSQHPTN